MKADSIHGNIGSTTRPYDAKATIKRIGSPKTETLRHRPLARFAVHNVAEGFLWCLDDRLLAIVLRIEPGSLDDLESIPARPRTQLEGTGETLRRIVRDRLPAQSLAWIAADLSEASALRDFLGLVGARLGGMQPVVESKAFAASLTADRDFAVQGQLLAASPKQMSALEPRLKALDWRGPTSLKIEMSPPDIEPWILLQARYDAAGLRRIAAGGVGLGKDE